MSVDSVLYVQEERAGGRPNMYFTLFQFDFNYNLESFKRHLIRTQEVYTLSYVCSLFYKM